MGRVEQKDERDGIAGQLSRLVQGLGQLISDRLSLARLELGEDVRTIGRRLGILALFLPFILAGWPLVCGALAVLLGRWITLEGGLLLVGGVNLIAGVVGLKMMAARLRVPAEVEEMADDVKEQAHGLVHGTSGAVRRGISAPAEVRS